MATDRVNTPDLEVFKERVKWMWSQGDYPQVALLLESQARKLASLCGIGPGMSVLDVAAGTGNFAIAAVELGGAVTATDFTPRMLELGRMRTESLSLPVTWKEADAEALPFDDRSFDVSASVFGAMFAARPDRVASELFRVVRDGGVVAMANYAPSGFLFQLSRLINSYGSAPPMPLPDPFEWGDREIVRERLGDLASSIQIHSDILRFEFTSPADWLEFWERTNAPQAVLKMMLPADRYREMANAALALVQDLNQSTDGRLVLESECLLVLAGKR